MKTLELAKKFDFYAYNWYYAHNKTYKKLWNFFLQSFKQTNSARF